MANFNSVVIVGRLTRDPELKYAPSGAPVCNFSLATSHKYTKDDGQKAESTTFLDVSAWRRLAEICQQFLKKGREVLVMGTLRQSRWVDPKTNLSRSKIRVVAQNVQFFWGRERADAAEPAEVAAAETQAVAEMGGES
ncbi:MAG TPA: single-stranded DNA-binding protein [Planctomycetota bacterium]